jgi:plasmid replication initiation protein
VDRDADDENATKETKTGNTREIDVLPALFPLLEAMHRESDGRGRLFPEAYEQPARELRVHLILAGVTREALHKSDKSRRRIRAQDVRASCATWLGLTEQLPDGGAVLIGRRVSGSYVRDSATTGTRLPSATTNAGRGYASSMWARRSPYRGNFALPVVSHHSLYRRCAFWRSPFGRSS